MFGFAGVLIPAKSVVVNKNGFDHLVDHLVVWTANREVSKRGVFPYPYVGWFMVVIPFNTSLKTLVQFAKGC